MKKTLAILTLVVMLAALIVPVAMAMVEATAACDHPTAVVSGTIHEYRKKNNSVHAWCKVVSARCSACNAFLGETVSELSTAPHSNFYGRVYGEHGSGTSHPYTEYCGVCNGKISKSMTCYGPPCSLP